MRVARTANRPVAAMVCASAAILGVLSEFFPRGVRHGLQLGAIDHEVLAPRGISWADPTAFVGDWFNAAAPQPHWLFDVVVWVGWSIGHITAVLFAYWLLTCLVFGLATTLLARAWVPAGAQAWLAVTAVSALAAVIPFTVAGSTWLGFPAALPNMLGGALLYLLTALLLTGRYRWTWAVLPATALVHVQIGAIALVLVVLGALALAPRIRAQRPARRLVAGYLGVVVATAGIVVVAMKARSVAAERADFIEICNTLIPFHCAAGTWTTPEVLVPVGAAVLTLAATGLVARPLRPLYLATLGVCAVGTVAAMFLDRGAVYRVGPLIQALNGYRVGLALYPYACWGLLVPLLRPASTWARLPAVLLAVVGMPLFFMGPYGKLVLGDFETWHPWSWWACAAYLLLAVLAALAQVRPRGDARRRQAIGAALLAALLVWVGASSAASGMTVKAPPSLAWAGEDAASWGAQARALIPVGSQVIIPPTQARYRLMMERGAVVDCKNIPYGGAPYREWKRRIAAVGGAAQCPTNAKVYDALPGATLLAAADTYGADAIMVAPEEDRAQTRELVDAGWTYRLISTPHIKTGVLLRPGLVPPTG